MIEDIVKDTPHVIATKNIGDSKCSQVYFNDDICMPCLPLEETIIEAYKVTYDKICMVYDDTSPCSPQVDEGLESLLPCNILKPNLLKKIVMNTRKTWIARSMMPWMKTPPHLTWMGMMTIGNLMKIPSTICPDKGVLI